MNTLFEDLQIKLAEDEVSFVITLQHISSVVY